jgi:hypothetical protein
MYAEDGLDNCLTALQELEWEGEVTIAFEYKWEEVAWRAKDGTYTNTPTFDQLLLKRD